MGKPSLSEEAIGVARRRWIGLAVVMAGAIAVVTGSLGRWVHGVSMRESEVVNSTERHWMVGAGIALVVVALAVGLTFDRAGLRLGWVQFVAWLHAALVVGVSTVDAGKRIGSSKPDLGDRLGWGLWLACAGVAVALVGMVVANRAEGDSAG